VQYRVLPIALVLAASPHATARAQTALPTGYVDLIACGAFWLFPQADLSVRIRRDKDGKCGNAELSVTVVAASSSGASLSVRARSPHEALRLPLRLFIDLDSIVMYRSARKDSPGFARLHQLVSAGDAANQSSLEVLDNWNIHMWRLSDAPSDTMRIAELAPDSTTLARTISVSFGAAAQRPDSIRVPFTLSGQRPAPERLADRAALRADADLRDIPLVRDTTLFPLPFYDGIVVVRMDRRAGPLTRQLVLDRLQGRLLAERPGVGSEPDLIIQVGPAWRDSLKQKDPQRKLSREVVRFGYLLRDQDQASLVPMKTPRDTTVIDAHYDGSCRVRADRESHRRLALVLLRDASAQERQQLANLFGAQWRSAEGDTTSSYQRLEMVGTRNEVNRQLAFMLRLPQVSSAHLNNYIGFSGPVCP